MKKLVRLAQGLLLASGESRIHLRLCESGPQLSNPILNQYKERSKVVATPTLRVLPALDPFGKDKELLQLPSET